jgi:hypothetical protein
MIASPNSIFFWTISFVHFKESNLLGTRIHSSLLLETYSNMQAEKEGIFLKRYGMFGGGYPGQGFGQGSQYPSQGYHHGHGSYYPGHGYHHGHGGHHGHGYHHGHGSYYPGHGYHHGHGGYYPGHGYHHGHGGFFQRGDSKK